MSRWSRTETEELLDLGRIVMMERMVCGRLVVVLGGDYGVWGLEISAFMNELDGSWEEGACLIVGMVNMLSSPFQILLHCAQDFETGYNCTGLQFFRIFNIVATVQ